MSQLPNIILCTCDQLRPFETGCYGNTVIQTPNVDRLAAEGVRFEHAVTNYPVCMAARSVLLSGQYNRTCTGGVSNVGCSVGPGQSYMPEYPESGRPHLKDVTLPELLRDGGYDTAAIGKWHIHTWPHDIGFGYYLISRVHHCHTGQSFTENGGAEFVPEGYSVDFESSRVEQYLSARSGKDQPFFLFFNISPPHCPIADIPESYRTMYRPEDMPLRPNADPDRRIKDQDHWFKIYRWDFKYYQFHLPYTEQLPDDYTLRHVYAEYYGMTTWMDYELGRMLGALDAAGLADNTIVLFTSDHGDNLGSHGLVQKGGPNEESIRVPFLVRWPERLPALSVADKQVASLVDVAPTLLAMAGIQCPGHMHGVNLFETDQVCGSTERPHAFFETPKGAGIRTPSHMCFLPYQDMHRSLSERSTELFDLIRDPFELANLAGDESARDVAQPLEALLRKWDESTAWMQKPEL